MDCLNATKAWLFPRAVFNKHLFPRDVKTQPKECLPQKSSPINTKPQVTEVITTVQKENLEKNDTTLLSSTPPIHPPRKKIECDILCVGLSTCGISTTISTLLNEKNSSVLEDSSININNKNAKQEITKIHVPCGNREYLNIIDVPGFCRGNYNEQDAELVLGLKTFLKNNLPHKIPNATFIISRFDDNRFQGEGSEFSKMLLALSHSRVCWTDRKMSNVILVLTHCSKIMKNVYPRILAFQETFNSIFPTENDDDDNTNFIPCILVENTAITESRKRLFEAIDTISKQRRDRILPKILPVLKNQVCKIASKKSTQSISELLPESKRDVNQLMDLILQGQPYIIMPNHHFEEKESASFFVPYYKSYSNFTPDGKMYQRTTKLLPSAKLLLPDFSTVLVSKIQVGYKVLNKNFVPTVVTRVRKLRICINNDSTMVGRYFATPHASSSQEEHIVQLLKYFERSKRIKEVDFNEHDVFNKNQELSSQKLPNDEDEDLHAFYEILLDEEDYDYGTYIVDGFVMYSRQ